MPAVTVRRLVLSSSAIVLLGGFAPPSARPLLAGHDVAPFHLRLEKSEPASGSTVSGSPSVIRLWFSLPPEMALMSVKLSDAAQKPVTLTSPRRGSGAKDPVEVDIPQKLAPGSYTVAWKTSSKDGHPVSGDFTFTVAAGTK